MSMKKILIASSLVVSLGACSDDQNTMSDPVSDSGMVPSPSVSATGFGGMIDTSATQLVTQQKQADSNALKFQVIKTPTLNIRTGPSLKYPVVGTLKLGQVVQQHGQQDFWKKISPDQNLWASGRYMSLVGNYNNALSYSNSNYYKFGYGVTAQGLTVPGTCAATFSSHLQLQASQCNGAAVKYILNSCPELKPQSDSLWSKYCKK